MSPTPNLKHEATMFDARDGARLFRQNWYPEGKPKAVMVIVHGLAEHSTRYRHVAEFLCAHDIAVETFDLRGHGQSEGKRIYINRFSNYLDDLDQFLLEVRQRFPSGPLFLFGHSMGGAIATAFVLENQIKTLNGLLLSGAAVKVGEDISAFLQAMSSVISAILPTISTITLDSSAISRDPAVVSHYDQDPLNFRGPIPARTGAELIKAQKQIQKHAGKLIIPTLIMHGTADRLADPNGSRILYEKALSSDKTLKLYDGFYHEILNDPEKQRVLDDMLSWMESHLT
ncbi:MAG TPA: alpha/beta hydrolase [Candidatus Marinimicrobia bacterium]|nr:MAG: hypothetical protein AUJ47_12115 [Candidatus Marinimicrobia bacterium CG1_02_48_14]PIZ69120.1 MAG: alpha/beta hydrolase [Candidatus Marinimicrobia bacterium CG_4_10_14_0_2_um_filter_48_9]HCW75158.1 alpha/beta hydrolase [Candidatus Neomarinimicrobiota bacterium]